MVDFSKWQEVLEPVDYVRLGAVLVAFLATGLGSAEKWIKADTIGYAVAGLAWILFPAHFLSAVTNITIDAAHTGLVQELGIVAFSAASFNYMNRSSRDPNVWLGVFFSRIMSLTLILLADIQIIMAPAKEGWTIKHIVFGVALDVAVFVASLLQAWKTPTRSSISSQRGKADHLSKHLFICLLIEISGFLLVYGFQSNFLEFLLAKPVKLDPVRNSLTKYGGGMLLMCAVMTLASLNYEDNNARKSMLLVKFWSVLALLGLYGYLQVMHSLFSKAVLPWIFIFYTPYMLVTGLGYLSANKHM